MRPGATACDAAPGDGDADRRRSGRHAFGSLADRFGRRPTCAFYMIGAAIMVVVYAHLSQPGTLLVGGVVLGFFVNGMIGGYGALIGKLYPTAALAS
ncbi:hypothetical protein [Acidisoma silvae]|uniref:Major facilitator superfamily (MFS) profile domain-containing protein n=1 Tax=Acidisoma silvae TaxID=2802396 RepID=A0A963YT18_9PROT|nr:hypothetical protein [Acidisoma silvae]MCB8875997.1 hypothetical protein [Acidisoma silvae]